MALFLSAEDCFAAQRSISVGQDSWQRKNMCKDEVCDEVEWDMIVVIDTFLGRQPKAH
jgi:hypothetical protein